MSDNANSTGAIIQIQLGGSDQALRVVNSLTKSEKDLKSSVESTTKALSLRIDAARRSMQTMADAAKQVPIGIQKSNEAQERLIKNLERTRAEAKDVNAEFNRTREALLAADKQAGSLAARLQQAAKIKASAGGYDDEINNFFGSGGGGDSPSPGGKKRNFAPLIQRAAGSLGLGPVAEIAGVVDDVGELGTALTEAGVSATTLTGAVVGAGVAAVALGVAVKIFSDRADQGKNSVDAATNSLKVYYDAVTSLTTEQAQQQLETAKTNQKRISDELQALTSSRDRAFTELAQKNPVGDLGARIQTLFDGFRGADGQMASVNDRIKVLQTEANNASGEISGLERALNDGSLQANDAKNKLQAYNDELERQSQLIVSRVSEAASQQLRVNKEIAALEGQSAEQLAKKRDALQDDIKFQAQYIKTLESTGEPSEQLDAQINQAYLDLQIMTSVLKYVQSGAIDAAKANETYKKSLDDATKAADEFAANVEKLRDLQSQQADIAEKRARDDSRAAQVSALEDQIASAREAEAEQSRQEKIVSARQKGAADEVAALNKLRDDRAKLNADYMAGELRELRAFQKEQSRADDAHKLERIRNLEDLYDDLSSLAAKGDISAFIEAQGQGLKQIRRGDQDADIATRQRGEDYSEGVQQRADERRQRLADLEQGFFEERTARQKSLREQIEQEEAAGQVRILQSAKLQEQLTALRDQWAKEDLVRTRREEDARIAEQIAAVRKRNAELQPIITKFLDPAATSIKNFASSVANSLSDMFNRVRAAAAARPTTPSRTTGTTHALGEVYTKPTVGVMAMAEVPGYGDAVIPFRQSDGVLPALQSILSKSGGGRGGLTINHLEIKTGSVATTEDLDVLRKDLLGALDDVADGVGATGLSEGAA